MPPLALYDRVHLNLTQLRQMTQDIHDPISLSLARCILGELAKMTTLILNKPLEPLNNKKT